jgi:protein-disulfide isomerase
MSAVKLRAAQDACSGLTVDKQGQIINYLKTRYNMPESIDIKIVGISTVDQSCYRKIDVEAANATRAFSVYLSPDQRYMSSVLMDLSVDPRVEKEKRKAALREALSASISPTYGEKGAPVTIVEFSDFECPFCKRFASIFEQLPPDKKQKVQLIFKQMPLKMHPWAYRAAKISTCVGHQNEAAFWKTHDFFFANQENISAQNIDDQFFAFSTANKLADDKQLRVCLDSGEAEAELERDRVLAQQVGAQGTPTLFVNGNRIPGVRGPADLIKAIDDAMGANAQSVSLVRGSIKQ